jgi:ferredoxin-NADP reductase
MELWQWLSRPAETSLLAFLTTLHCALALLRHYRSSGTFRFVVLPSVAFVALPWVLPAFGWLIVGGVAHLSWFIACERLLPVPGRVQPIAAPPPPTPRGFQPLTVLSTFVETNEIRSFRFARPPGFSFRAGQFVMVRTPLGVRCYSITSAPESPGYLEIAVRNQGAVSRHLHEHLHSQSTIEVNGPGGAFVYPDGDRPIILLAGGIGITPLLSMLRHGVACEPLRPVTLILSAKTQAHVPFADELRIVARRHPHVRVFVTLTAAPAAPPFLQGRIDAALIRRVVAQPQSCVFMMCGPLQMIDELRQALETLAVPKEQVHFEKFEAAVSIAGETGAAARVSLQKSKRTFAVGEGQTILDAADAAGISLPSLCRIGACATCRLRLVSGEVAGDFDALDATEQAHGDILACVARPRSDCVIDA